VPLNFAVDSARLDTLHEAPGVIDFVQFAGQLATISLAQMREIRLDESAAMVPRTKASVFALGEAVKLIEGPLQGFPATIEALDENDKADILVQIFGRKTRVRIECECIGKL
jgi:transcription antitermination factor NusG